MLKNSTVCAIVALFLLLPLIHTSAQVSLSVLNSPSGQDFNTLAISGTSSLTPTGWVFVESGTNQNGLYTAGTGSGNAGDTYSFGTAGSTERAIGGLRSGSLIPIIGSSFINNTGAFITGLSITFTGEQWRLGTNNRPAPDRLDFQYSLSATSLTTGTWTDKDSLDFIAPRVSAAAAGALPGNDPANRTTLTATLSGISIAPGSTFWIRWTDLDISGADDGLAIDDFSITPHGIPGDQPNLTFTPASLSFGQVLLGGSRDLTYTFDGVNLDSQLTSVKSANGAFTLSVDGTTFTDSLAVADSTILYVRFTPSADGSFSGGLLHSNGEFTKSLNLQGTGYDPLAHVIPIATARGLSVGTQVTVAGRVTSANQLGSPSYLQDATGGIPVFDFNLSNNVAIGDTLVVTGPIGTFSQQIQISGSGISWFAADSTPRVLTPKPIDITELAANEGLLVTVQNVELANKSFVFFPQSTEVITNGSTNADLRIDGDTNIPGLAKPLGVGDITGVVGRFNANAQLLPRFREDIPGATEPATPSDSIPVSSTFDLMNWNLEFFGAEREDYPDEFGPADEPLQLANISQVILHTSPDLIAAQEVSDEAYFNQLVDELPGYASVCSGRWSYSFQGPDNTFPPQKLCFIYNTSTVEVISSRPMFEELYDAARTGSPGLLPGIPEGASSFWSSGRLPFILTADVTVDGVKERIHFVNLHAKSGAALVDYQRRKYDMQVLKDSLDAQAPDDQYVILGDINDDLDGSITTGQPTPYESIVLDTARYSPITLALSQSGARSTTTFTDVIDHQILSNELDEEYISGSARILTPFGLIPNYGNTTTDHLPVLSRYQFVSPEVSFAMAADSVMEGDSLVVVLSLSRPASTATTIAVTVAGEATYGDDFSTVPGAIAQTLSIHLAEGDSSVSFEVHTIDDEQDEIAEIISFGVAAGTGVAVGEISTFLLTIEDNDLPSIAFEQDTLDVEEGQNETIRLVLSSPSPSPQNVTISFQHSRGLHYILDYTTTPGPRPMWKMTLPVPAGDTEVTFTLDVNDDRFDEGDEVVIYTILSVSAGITQGAPSTLAVTIKDVEQCVPLFVLHPNPTHGRVNIWTPPSNEDKLVDGILLDPHGEVIVSTTGTVDELSDAFTEGLSGKRRGLYTVRLVLCGQEVFLRLIKL
jgi:hypothetical protein